MPYYKDLSFFEQSAHDDFEADPLAAGWMAPRNGVYMCTSCGYEIYLEGQALAPSDATCNDHPHWTPRAEQSRGPVRWKLIAVLMDQLGPRRKFDRAQFQKP